MVLPLISLKDPKWYLGEAYGEAQEIRDPTAVRFCRGTRWSSSTPSAPGAIGTRKNGLPPVIEKLESCKVYMIKKNIVYFHQKKPKNHNLWISSSEF